MTSAGGQGGQGQGEEVGLGQRQGGRKEGRPVFIAATLGLPDQVLFIQAFLGIPVFKDQTQLVADELEVVEGVFGDQGMTGLVIDDADHLPLQRAGWSILRHQTGLQPVDAPLQADHGLVESLHEGFFGGDPVNRVPTGEGEASDQGVQQMEEGPPADRGQLWTAVDVRNPVIGIADVFHGEMGGEGPFRLRLQQLADPGLEAVMVPGVRAQLGFQEVEGHPLQEGPGSGVIG